jgi:hypothetical protein
MVGGKMYPSVFQVKNIKNEKNNSCFNHSSTFHKPSTNAK